MKIFSISLKNKKSLSLLPNSKSRNFGLTNILLNSKFFARNFKNIPNNSNFMRNINEIDKLPEKNILKASDSSFDNNESNKISKFNIEERKQSFGINEQKFQGREEFGDIQKKFQRKKYNENGNFFINRRIIPKR